jgi:hypothetical protein
VRTGRLAIIVLSLLLVSATATMARGFGAVSSDLPPGLCWAAVCGATVIQRRAGCGQPHPGPDVAGSKWISTTGVLDLTDRKHTPAGYDSSSRWPRNLSVHWRAILSEGGETEGGFAFSVGARPAALTCCGRYGAGGLDGGCAGPRPRSVR